MQLKTTPISPSARLLLPDPVHCEYSSQALPPPAAQGVGFDAERLQYTSYRADSCELDLQVGVSWEKPEEGGVAGYEVRLVESADENSVGEIFASKTVEVCVYERK